MTQRPAILRLLAAGVLIAWVLPMSAGLVGDVRPKGSAGPASGFDPNGTYAPGEVLIKFRPEIPPAHRAAAMAVQRVRAIGRIAALDVYRVLLPEGTAVEEKAAALAADPRVLYAEPNYIGRASVTPNDNLFKYQYALSNIGQSIGDVPGSPQGKTGADIKATQGWEESRGDAAVTIAIVDSGVELTHPDLVGKIVGPGRDFVNDDYDASDDLYHGTAVAGIAAASTDNGEGIAGVGWNAMILPVKVLNDQGTGTVSQVADGIVWAAGQGAQVINLSLGFNDVSQVLFDAVAYASDQGCVLVAAAGNNGGPVQYPAAYNDYVLAVAATDYNDDVWEGSNAGPEVEVAAPGVSILTAVPTWFLGSGPLPYSRFDGTSMAAPHVSGLAAILKSLKPWLTAAQIREIIRLSADDVNAATLPGIDDSIGCGRINMAKALVPLKLEAGRP